jgi:hypothetical protein
MRPGFPPLLGYAVAAACAVVSLGLLTGLLRLEAARPVRIMAGIILGLLAVNRFLLLRYKAKPRRRRSFDREDSF